jgi:aminocarboxymuconate-semialdehyde decarboxylase
MRIDVHNHYLPETVVADLRGGSAGVDGIRIEWDGRGERVVHPGLGMRYPLKAEFYDLSAKLAHMDAHGIDVSILSIVPLWLFHWIEAEEAERFCRRANDWLAQYVARSARLRGMAMVPLQSPAAAVAELERSRALGLIGVEIGTTVGGAPLDDPRFSPFFAAAERLEMPVMIHPSFAGKPSPFAEFYMKNLIGNPLATAAAACRLILSGFLDRHADLTVILVHAGGFLPYQIGRLDHGYEVRAETRERLRARPSSYLHRFHFDTITHAPKPLRFLVDLVGAERVLYGTDIPFDMADLDFASIARDSGIADEAMDAIANGNARRLFKL